MLTPYYEEPGITIYNGDCLEVMKELPDKSVDLVLTDPPYSIGTTSTGTKGSWLDNNLIRPFFLLWFSEIKKCLKDGGEFYINTDWRTYPFLYPIAVESMRITNCIVWDYEWIKAGSHYRFSHEFIMYGQKTEGQKRKFPATKRDVWRIPPINFTVEKNHGAEKPVQLISECIVNSTDKENLVLDPFLGSGTTAVACKELNRKCIGIEISEKYCEICVKRLKNTIRPMF